MFKKWQTISIHFKSYLKHSIERDALSLAPGNIVFFKGTFLQRCELKKEKASFKVLKWHRNEFELHDATFKCMCLYQKILLSCQDSIYKSHLSIFKRTIAYFTFEFNQLRIHMIIYFLFKICFINQILNASLKKCAVIR